MRKHDIMLIELTYNKKIGRLLIYLFLATLVIILCFPELDLTFTSGIDPSLAWLYNHLFETGLAAGKNIIFPHGPLAFFMYPLYNNIETALLVDTILKIQFFINIFLLVRAGGKNRWLEGFLLCIAMAVILNFNLLLIGVLFSSYLLYLRDPKTYFLAIAFIINAFALYVKVYVAIVTSVITFSFLVYSYVNYKNLKVILLLFGSIVIITLLFWIVITGNITGIVHYFYGMFQLLQDNSSAAAYYPDNNWWLLAAFLIVIVFVPLVPRSKKGLIFTSITFLAVFAAWKHGMAREDIYHTRNFFFFIFMIYTLYMIFNRKYIIRNILLITLALIAFEINIASLYGYTGKTCKLPGITNFTGFVQNRRELKEKARQLSLRNIQYKVLPDTVMNLIKDGYVDIYPWEYTYLAANNLNWTPRPVVQSYAAYTSWLDRQNALHFDSQKAPEFIIWELNKETKDINDGRLESIDNRYLLNDEPNTMYTMFKNYSIIYKSQDLLLFKKSNRIRLGVKTDIKSGTVTWNEWVEVPEKHNAIIRAKIDSKENLFGRLKSILYKGEECYLYYKLENDEIIKYKIIPKNARDGVWINPLILHPETEFNEPQVVSIQFRSSNRKLMMDKISITWEEIPQVLNTDSSSGEELLENIAQMLFNKTLTERDSLTFELSIDSSLEFWQFQCKNESVFGKYDTIVIPVGEYSPVFGFDFNSLGCDAGREIQILYSAWIKAPRNGKSAIVFSINNNDQTYQWDPVYINCFIINEKEMNYIYGERTYFLQEFPYSSYLKLYILNSDKTDLLCNDIKVKIIIKE